VSDASTLLADAVDTARGLGRRLAAAAGDVAGQVDERLAALPSPVACSCGHHRACWMPDERRPLRSRVSGCGTARVTIEVRSCGLAERDVFVAATGADAGLAHGSPSSARVGAFDTAELVAEVDLPEGQSTAHLLLWVRGCHDTVIPWTVSSSDDDCDGRSSHTVRIDDCPDTHHHWSDHFAQPKPCRGRHDG
jgi:hypothetical protein